MKRPDDAPKITVISVTYNDVRGLRATIASVQSQSYTAIEHLVVDGGSTDSTLETLKAHGDRLRWLSEPDRGIYDAMNKGMRLATGAYVIFLNAGDTFHAPDTVAEAAKAITMLAPPPLIAYGDMNVLTKDDHFVKTLRALRLTKGNLNRFATRTVCHQSVFVARGAAPQYDARLRLKGELDWYYKLVRTIPPDRHLRLNLIVCDYRQGGRGETDWMLNELERVRVTRTNNGFLAFVFAAPFFLIPVLFLVKERLSAILTGR
jgi:glycosyltransferase involved in cell wall biosynthesis